MVSMSNWPPLVAMSVVTRWRSTFSSSVTHLTVISGFLAVNSLVRPCMRIMSPLFTVPTVNVVCANDGAATANRTAELSKAPIDFIIVSSRLCEHMLFYGAYAHSCLRGCQRDSMLRRSIETRETIELTTLQKGFCRHLVSDEARQQAPLQGGADSEDLGRPESSADGQGVGRYSVWYAGQASVGAALDDAALRVERPSNELPDRAEAHELQQFLTADEAVDEKLRALIDLTDADEA